MINGALFVGRCLKPHSLFLRSAPDGSAREICQLCRKGRAEGRVFPVLDFPSTVDEEEKKRKKRGDENSASKLIGSVKRVKKKRKKKKSQRVKKKADFIRTTQKSANFQNKKVFKKQNKKVGGSIMYIMAFWVNLPNAGHQNDIIKQLNQK